jgi:hypothetical protein
LKQLNKRIQKHQHGLVTHLAKENYVLRLPQLRNEWDDQAIAKRPWGTSSQSGMAQLHPQNLP